MFGQYSVSTASRHPSSIPCRDLNTKSYTSRAGPRPVPRPFSICQLSQRFSEQRLQHDAAATALIRSEPCDPALALELDETNADDQTSLYVGSATGASRRRYQRQQGVRMLCDPSHLRNIQDMVERMISSESQCAVSPPRTVRVTEDYFSNLKHDEGYSSLDENTSAARKGSVSSSSSASSYSADENCKRSSDSSIAGVRVSKNVRARKTRSRRSIQRTASHGL